MQARPQYTKYYTGVVRSPYETSLGFKVAGQINRILVNEGDMVRKGQKLAALDTADYSLAVRALEIQYGQICDELERLEKLYESKSLSANDYCKAKAGAGQLAVQLQANRNKLAYTSLYAPQGGYITEVNFSEGEMVDAGTPVFSLMGTSPKEVALEIPAGIYSRMDRILEIKCSQVGTAEGERIPMALLSVVPKADAGQLYSMRLGFLSSAGGALTVGSNVTVGITLRIDRMPGEAVIPLHSIVREGGKNYVYVVTPESAVSRREVTVTLVDEGRGSADVLGLDTCDLVVSEGAEVLNDGDRVKVIPSPSDTNIGGLL